MKPEDINRAIAEHCGWEFLPERDTHCRVQPECWESPDGERIRESCAPYPNYHGDLNAMHEAEKMLSREQVLKYQDHLFKLVCTLDTLFPATRDCAMQGFLHHATSAQRAEAFLRTIGKWNDQ